MENMFQSKPSTFTFVNEKSNIQESFEQHAVICNDLNGLVDRIIEKSEINEENMLVRIGLDGGGGFMKICLSMFDFSDTADKSSSNGGKCLKEWFKNSGVKKVLIIAVVPNIQENYCNIKSLWLEACLENLTWKFTISTDFAASCWA